MMKARTLLVLIALVAVLLGLTAPTFSTAAFTSSSTTAESTIQASSDWTAPKVSMTAPGAALRDTVTLTAEASDADSEISSVTLQHRGPNATEWTDLCTDTTAPYSCSWNTTDSDDGAYSLRAVATDSHSNTKTSEVMATAVANQLTVVVSAPSQTIRGATNLTTTLHNAGDTSYRVTVEFAPTGTQQWSTACADLSSPFTCSGNTAAMPDGVYDLRASATAGNTTVRSETVSKIRVDNTAPSVSMTNPGSPLKGSATFTSTASDSGSGISEVRMQYAATGSSTWVDLCTDSTAPYSCQYDTTKLTDGSYSFRAVAADRAGNSSTSAAVTERIVENTVSRVTMNNPGSSVSGTTTLSASASSTAGVRSVQMQFAPSGSNNWTTECTVTRWPYSCSWDSNELTNGSYSVRAVLTDGNGKETTSALVTGVRISNTVLEAETFYVVNGRTPGKVDSGDFINFAYSDQVNLNSISPGWNGSPRTVTLRLQDNSGRDTIDILSGSSYVNLGVLDLNRDYIDWRRTALFSATMTASTVPSSSGADRTLINITVGNQYSGGDVLVTNTGGWGGSGGYSNMTWTPSDAAKSPSGTPVSTKPFSTSGRF